jgi:spore maturation protein CgeB
MEEYRELLWQASIALGFVSWSNHDEFTMRSFEIPAAGTFLLAERTMTHQSLYVEGREAEFFDNSEECRDKLLYYLDHSPQRRQIAAAGHERCVKSGYGITDRLRLALQTVAEL